MVREGGAVLCSFIDWFLLLLVARCLLACLLGVSRISRERSSHLHLFGLSSLELGASLCRCERERLKWKRWETMLLIVMLESSSRSAPRNEARLMANSASLEVWRSTIIEVSCSSPSSIIVECKYSRVMMARSCASSAREASSSTQRALRSTTIMIASSSLTIVIRQYNHGH